MPEFFCLFKCRFFGNFVVCHKFANLFRYGNGGCRAGAAYGYCGCSACIFNRIVHTPAVADLCTKTADEAVACRGCVYCFNLENASVMNVAVYYISATLYAESNESVFAAECAESFNNLSCGSVVLGCDARDKLCFKFIGDDEVDILIKLFCNFFYGCGVLRSVVPVG